MAQVSTVTLWERKATQLGLYLDVISLNSLPLESLWRKKNYGKVASVILRDRGYINYSTGGSSSCLLPGVVYVGSLGPFSGAFWPSVPAGHFGPEPDWHPDLSSAAQSPGRPEGQPSQVGGVDASHVSYRPRGTLVEKTSATVANLRQNRHNTASDSIIQIHCKTGLSFTLIPTHKPLAHNGALKVPTRIISTVTDSICTWPHCLNSNRNNVYKPHEMADMFATTYR